MQSKRHSSFYAVKDNTKKRKSNEDEEKDMGKTRACNKVSYTQTYANKTSVPGKAVVGSEIRQGYIIEFDSKCNEIFGINRQFKQIKSVIDQEEARIVSDLPCHHLIGLVNSVPGTGSCSRTTLFLTTCTPKQLYYRPTKTTLLK